MSGSRSFAEIKAECLDRNILYCDPQFPPDDTAIGIDYLAGKCDWHRPKEIRRGAKFMSEGVSRFDVNQGRLGNCWFAAGVIALCDNPSLLDHVVPAGQSLEEEYAGVFRFNFWHYGTWTEVVVDDRLPTSDGKLTFIQSTDSTEFWSALLEKAYAKLHGSYGALKGASGAIECMEDLTGGVCELYNLGDDAPEDLFQIMHMAVERSSLLGGGVKDKSQPSGTLENGLVNFHAYTINLVKEITLENGDTCQLIRFRNPWGNNKEWNGDWSDGCEKWDAVSSDVKDELNFAKCADGEFWMSYDDFIINFHQLEICNLGPDALTEAAADSCQSRWDMTQHEGSWVRNVSAGGCPMYHETFGLNPQFMVEVESSDEDSDGCGTIIVCVMQKPAKGKQRSKDWLHIGYGLFKHEDPDKGRLEVTPWMENLGGRALKPFREISDRHRLPAGHYCVIPFTYEPGVDRDFLMRIYSERPNKLSEINENTQSLNQSSESIEESEDDTVITDSNENQIDISNGPMVAWETEQQPEENGDDEETLINEAIKTLSDLIVTDGRNISNGLKITQSFKDLAGEGLELDAYRLRDVLSAAYGEEFRLGQFSIDVCKSMVAMLDDDLSGKLSFREFRKLWKSLRKWTHIFRKYNVDGKGFLCSSKLRHVIRSVGYSVSNQTFLTLVQRYGDLEGHLGFQDYLHCVIKLSSTCDVFKESEMGGVIMLDIDKFIQHAMYG